MGERPRVLVRRGGRWWWRAWIVRGAIPRERVLSRDADWVLFGSRERAEAQARAILGRVMRRDSVGSEFFEVRIPPPPPMEAADAEDDL